MLKEVLKIMFGMIFTQNYVLVQFIAICPFLGVSKKFDSCIGMSGAGQTFTDRGEHLILGNAHVLGSDNEDQRGHRADDEQNNNGTYNSRHVTFLP